MFVARRLLADPVCLVFATLYFHHDQQGSTRTLTNQSGVVVATNSTDPYGTPTASSGTTQTPLGYDSEYRDRETGFTCLRNRYYDPTTTQFLTRDPANAITQSAYGYVDGNPLNFTDPTGVCTRYHNGRWVNDNTHKPCPGAKPPKYGFDFDRCPNLSGDNLVCLDPAWNKAHPFGGNKPAYYYACGTLYIFEGCLNITNHGGVFATGGLGKGSLGVSAGTGYINGVADPSACQVNSFLAGPSATAGGGLGLGGSAVWGNEGSSGRGAFGHEEGLIWPGGGGAYQENTWGLFGNTSTEGCGCD